MVSCAIYPGTFDPITYGHQDLIRRASKLFDQVIVGVAASSNKAPLFSLKRRISLIMAVTKTYHNVEVASFTNLLVNFAQQYNAKILLRGLRTFDDFSRELQLATINRKLAPELETVFLMPSEQYGAISSSLVKEVAEYKGDISALVDPIVAKAFIK